jgi:hypothetical protein
MSSHVALLEGPSLYESHKRGLRYLTQHLVPAEDGSGFLFIGKARSRVLESALTLHLLRQSEKERDWRWQNRLRDYLQTHSPQADGLSSLISAAVLGYARPQGVLERLRQLMGGLEYARRRKLALLAMLLVEIGLISLEEAQVRPEDFSEKAAHRFSRIYCSALRLMYHRKAPLSMNPIADVRFLEESQAANGSWEQQGLLTLLAMMGLGRTHPAFWMGLEYLRGTEREDGGIPFIDNQDVWVNALAGLTLQANGLYPDVQDELASFLLYRQQNNGGWAFTDGVAQTETDSTANVVQMLLQRDRNRYVPAVDRALEYFRSLQRDDGGYPTYEREGDSEITMTANVLLVQSMCVGRHPDLEPNLRRACQFILERQHSDGRFEKSWSVCETYSIFRVLWALDAYTATIEAPRVETARARALRYLRESQNENGGWGQGSGQPSDALSTAYALASLGLLRNWFPVEQVRTHRGVSFLLSQQDQVTGSFISVPDLVGPRPILFDLPLLSTVFSLLALSFVWPGGPSGSSR